MRNLKLMVAFAALCTTAVPYSIYAVNPLPVISQAKITVSGMVIDETGLPVIGANVIVAGTTNGVVTDVDGRFTLPDIAAGATLVVSFIGYQATEVKARPSLEIVLKEDTELLDEVVVVGYGSMARKDVTSSITTVKADDLNIGVYSSPAQLLQGKVAGLTITQSSNPNGTPSITLRGASTIRSGAEASEPYYVIDGVPGVSLSLIAPDDIESIDVLRDASATAIYGSKAANGVIIVTTKKGKAGHTSVNYSAYVAMDKVAKTWDLMNGNQHREYALANGFAVNPNDDLGYETDWQKEVERTGLSTNHNISISGGTEKTIYSASLNYMKNNGVVRGTDLERYIGRAFVETKGLNDRLTLSFNVNASISEQNDVPAEGSGQSVYDAMLYYLPYSPVRNEDGSWFENLNGKTLYYNPIAMIEENTNYTKTRNIQATGKASLKIMDGLTYNATMSYESEQIGYNRYYSSNSMLANGDNGKATRASVENENKLMEMYLNYDKVFNDVHKLGVMLGYSWEESQNNNGFQLTTYNFFSDDLLYYNMGMANNVDMNGFGDYNLSTLRMISFYGRANYSYASKYLLQATLRRDGSSAFGVNNRWATFPSASVAWRASEESFIKDMGVFDDLKLRLGYGVSGNSLGFDVFTATQLYGETGWFTNAAGNQVHTIGAIQNSNPDLKWERTSMFNVGIDFGFFKNRLNGTIEYYSKQTDDLISNYEVSTTQYIFNTLTANVGEISNKGIELTLNAVPVQTKDFTWSTTVNLSHNKNEVKRLSNSEFSVNYLNKAELGGAGQSSCYQQRVMEGRPIGQFYTWEWAGYNDEGVSVFYVHDPETGERTGETTAAPQDSDRTFTGCAQPKLNLGWNNSFTYKNFTLTAFFQGVFGNDIMNGTRASLSQIGRVGSKNVLASAAETENPKDINAHYLSDRYLENGSYLRLSTLSLGYNFGKLGNWVNNLRVYATCNNVFTLTSYKGLDPEINLGGVENPGCDFRNTYPKTRSFMLGVNVNF